MQAEFFDFYGADGQLLPAVIWAPENPKAVIQVIHGMTEHMGRYEAFATEMAARGIAVAGFDLRGHGKNAGDPVVASFGEGGWQTSVADVQLFHYHLQHSFPGVPQYMLGFSLGSFLLRDFLKLYPTEELAGAVIMGTGHQPGWLLSLMMKIVIGQIKKVGFNNTSDLVKQLSFGTYNGKFKPNRTEADWLCANADALGDYLADPLVRRQISAGLFWELLNSMKRHSEPEEYAGWNHALPILLISGDKDPVGDGGKGVKAICQRMRKSGMQAVQMQLIPGARHDVLHESDAAQRIIADWLEG